MKLDNNTGEVITLDEAIKFTTSFQERNPNQIKSHFAGGEKLKLILQQENCIGIRIYNGYDADRNEANLVLVGVDKDGEDIAEGIIVENLKPCPTECPKNSSLMK